MEKTAIVTGASGGIGSACAKALAQQGFKVLLVYNTNKPAADKLSYEINMAGGKAECFQADLAYPVEFPEGFSSPDVLVNCAGISVYGLFQDLCGEDWDAVMNANVKSVYHAIQAVLPSMIDRKSGSIINMASMWGEVGASCEAAYSASKGAVIALTKALAKELGPSGIRVNCVSPGCIDTPMLTRLGEDTVKALAEETPLGRIGTPEDTAGAVAFLASDAASFITGQILGVNGGFVI